MVDKENSIKRKFIAKETYEILRGIDSNHNEIINQYTILDELGEGSFSTVKLFIDNNTQKQYATKIINKRELEKKRKGIRRAEDGHIIVDTCLKDAVREIAILKRLDCKNIIKLREIIHDNQNSRIYLVMELAEKGAILDFDQETETFSINNNFLLEDDREPIYSEEEIKDFMRGIVNGLYYLHEQGIVHRDIKPDNILLDQNNIPKITDFNVSAMVGRGRPNQVEKVEGTIYFYAPELCEIENEDCLKFDAFPLDIWALGITLYCLVYLEVPFKSSNEVNSLNIVKQISKGVIELPETRKISEGLKSLIQQLLNNNPSKRPTTKELMEDEWLNEGRDPLSKIHKSELIKVTEEEIEQSLDFFLSDAKNRNYDLDIKEKKYLLSASSVGKKSIKSINNTLSSNKAIGKLNSTLQQSNKMINKSSSPMKLNDSNYFYSHQQSMRMINKPRITEDEFFDN